MNGVRLALSDNQAKILNASRFALGTGVTAAPGVTPTAPLDRALLTELSGVVTDATTAFDAYDHAGALERIERFFWSLCDDYLELVKTRAYDGDASARATLSIAFHTVLRLFAPFLPYVTEEVWSWWQDGSVHQQPWPDSVPHADGDPLVLDAVADALRAVRKAKTDAQASMRADVTVLRIAGPESALDRVRQAEGDLRAAGRIAAIDSATADEPSYAVTLA